MDYMEDTAQCWVQHRGEGAGRKTGEEASPRCGSKPREGFEAEAGRVQGSGFTSVRGGDGKLLERRHGVESCFWIEGERERGGLCVRGSVIAEEAVERWK